jgi:hypothetical protein
LQVILIIQVYQVILILTCLDARPGVKSLGSFGTAEASTTFPQGDMVITGFKGYSQFGSEDTQFGFGSIRLCR